MAPGVQLTGVVAMPGKAPLHPGDRTRAAIVPIDPESRDQWRDGGLGNEVSTMEGWSTVGVAVVEWMTERADGSDLWDRAVESFSNWCSGGPRPT